MACLVRFAIFSSENRNDTNMKHFIIIMVTALAGWTIALPRHKPTTLFSATCFSRPMRARR